MDFTRNIETIDDNSQDSSEGMFGRTLQFLRKHELLPENHYLSDQLIHIDVGQARALISYASERGINADSVKSFHQTVDRFFKEKASTGTVDQNTASQLIAAYSELCDAIREDSNYYITGRSIMESQNLGAHIAGLRWLTILLLIIGMGLFAIRLSGIQLMYPLADFMVFLRYFEPSLWGALGSCVFILKRVYDKARTFQFDPQAYQSWRIRVVIGFVLAPVVNFLIDANFLTHIAMEKQFKVAVIAFLTGIGVKVFYGALESVVDNIASRFSLDKSDDEKIERKTTKQGA